MKSEPDSITLLETDRLVLRSLEPGDIAPLLGECEQIAGDPDNFLTSAVVIQG
jgi:hypothetical protein